MPTILDSERGQVEQLDRGLQSTRSQRLYYNEYWTSQCWRSDKCFGMKFSHSLYLFGVMAEAEAAAGVVLRYVLSMYTQISTRGASQSEFISSIHILGAKRYREKLHSKISICKTAQGYPLNLICDRLGRNAKSRNGSGLIEFSLLQLQS